MYEDAVEPAMLGIVVSREAFRDLDAMTKLPTVKQNRSWLLHRSEVSLLSRRDGRTCESWHLSTLTGKGRQVSPLFQQT